MDELEGQVLDTGVVEANAGRTLYAERRYSIGDWKWITFSDSMKELPFEVGENPELINKLRFLQMLQIEKAFHQYMKLQEKERGMSREEVLELVDELAVETIEELKTLIKNGE